MKKGSRKRSSTDRKNRKQNKPKGSRKREAAPMAPAVVVGTTKEEHPKLVVSRPVTLAEAIAEPVIDTANEKPISVRKLARRIA